jgi:hypothetical protein
MPMNVVIKITSTLGRLLNVFTAYMNLLSSSQQVSARIRKKMRATEYCIKVLYFFPKLVLLLEDNAG